MFTAPDHPLIKDCSITKNYGTVSKTFFLWGTVRIITDPREYADFDVKIVPTPGLAAMYVQKVTAPPYYCGRWRFVNSQQEKDEKEKATFTVRFVDEMEDFTVCFVESEPGSRY